MKILVLEHAPSSQCGGQEHSLLDVCRGLASHGHGIYLVHTQDGDLLDDYRQFCKSIVRVRRYTIDRSSLVVSLSEWVRSIVSLLRIDSDVIYVNQYHDTFFGGVLARLKRIPLVCHLRLFPPATFCGQWRIGLSSVTHFIAGSQATRNAYLMAGFSPETIDVVYNGIDPRRFARKADRDRTRNALGIPTNTFVIFYPGRIDRMKNIEILLQSLARFSLPVDEVQLLIAGGPREHGTDEAGALYVEELKSLSKNLGVEKHVQWLGRRSDLPALFRACDVTVLPSKLPETFGRTLIESMACETPAIGARLGGVPEVLHGEFNALCFENNSVSELTGLLQFLKDWRTSDPYLGRRCRLHVEGNFSRDKMIKEVEAAMFKAVKPGAKRLGPSLRALREWHDGTWTIFDENNPAA